MISDEFSARFDAVQEAFNDLESIFYNYKEKAKIDESFIL